MENDLLVEFHKKFTLPREQEWQDFLSSYMPLFKQEKKASKRVAPFDIEGIRSLLEMTVHYLKRSDISKYVSLDDDFAPGRIHEFIE